MQSSRDASKVEQERQLQTEIEEFLSRGGVIRNEPIRVSNGAAPERLKFTRRDDASIGYTTADRPSTKKQEMTIMSTTEKKPAAKPATAKPAAAPHRRAEDAPKRTVPTAPSFDIAGLVLEKDVVMPERASVSRSAWVPVLLKMEIGDSYFIEDKTPANLSYVKKIGAKNGVHIELFNRHEKAEDGELVQGTRMFRVEAPAEGSDDGLGEE